MTTCQDHQPDVVAGFLFEPQRRIKMGPSVRWDDSGKSARSSGFGFASDFRTP